MADGCGAAVRRQIAANSSENLKRRNETGQALARFGEVEFNGKCRASWLPLEGVHDLKWRGEIIVSLSETHRKESQFVSK